MSSPPNSREWNAADYHRLSAPQFYWGQRVLSELHLRGDECVLDAGCGTGRLTQLLLENLPQGRVVGLDVSRNMAMHAQSDLRPAFGERAQFVVADLVSLPFRDAFDGIFSTASFHWVLDHDVLFRNLFAALRPGGWLHAQCGGGSNVLRLRQRARTLSQTLAFASWLADFPEPWYFSDAESAGNRLRATGFEQVRAELETAHVTVSSSEEFQDYLRTFVLHRHLERLPSETQRTQYVQELAAASANDDPPWTLDYCRLNLRAYKPL
ncbi:MAG TPA: methyltransferase domain-containing protein [Terriglobales bacterium]|nr:methyltransferase domain-containing protein [Terriglobales bacterium]